MSYFLGGSPANYTVGGARFWFDRLVDASTTPPRYEGYRDFGNVVDSAIASEKDILDHFSIRSGTRMRDRSLTREITEDVVLTLDELSIDNLRGYFNAGAITAVAAGVGTGVASDEIHQVRIGETTILGKGYNAASIVVKDIGDTLTYTTPDDYTVVDIIGGYKGLLWAAGSVVPNLVAGDFVRIDYVYDVRAHKTFNPLTETDIQGKAVFFGVSDTGNEFIREFERVQLEREGDFTLNPEDWSTFQLRMKILDDSEANPTMPAGIMRHYGVGTDL
jgi:hypothetical protein